MFGLIKKIFKKDTEQPMPAAPPVTPSYARTATPSQPGRPASNPFSQNPTAPTLNPTAAVRPPSNAATGSLPDGVSLPLGTIVAALPPEFQNLFTANPQAGVEIEFALQGILPQLSSGRVRVAFGELRQACPNGVCKAGPEHDARLIDLPLASVVSRISPALLPRKTQRQLMDVPKDVTGLFGAMSEPVSVPPTAPAPAPASSAPVAPAPAAPSRAVITPSTRRKSAVPADLENIPSPFAAAAPAAKAPTAPVAEVPAPAAPVPVTKRRSAVPADLEAIPAPFSFPGTAAAAEAPVEAAEPVAFEPEPEPVEEPPMIKFDAAAVFAKAKQAAPTPPPARSSAPAALPKSKLQEVKDDNYLAVVLSEVSEGWPETILAEINELGLSESEVALPVGEVDLAMRKGRIAFPWKSIRSWIGNAPPVDSSPDDDQELLLPLKVVAPKFLALRQPKGRQKKAHVEESIPDLFSGGPGPAPAVTAAPVAATPAAPAPKAPAAAPAVMPLPVAAPVATPTAPQKAARKATAPISAANPNELVAKTAQLPGVSGALLAMNDGLVVASQLPKPLQGETVSAFLPQIFGRLTQFASELKLGELSSVMLVMDNCPWIIFRTGKVYFAVMGAPGEALPLPQLTAIVSDIKRQNL